MSTLICWICCLRGVGDVFFEFVREAVGDELPHECFEAEPSTSLMSWRRRLSAEPVFSHRVGCLVEQCCVERCGGVVRNAGATITPRVATCVFWTLFDA